MVTWLPSSEKETLSVGLNLTRYFKRKAKLEFVGLWNTRKHEVTLINVTTPKHIYDVYVLKTHFEWKSDLQAIKQFQLK